MYAIKKKWNFPPYSIKTFYLPKIKSFRMDTKMLILINPPIGEHH